LAVGHVHPNDLATLAMVPPLSIASCTIVFVKLYAIVTRI